LQYVEYIANAQKLDMELAVEFLIMASDLMLIKSKMLLPREEDEEEEDPRASLADALQRLEAAKNAAAILSKRYEMYSGRMAKESDEVDVDNTFVAPQELDFLAAAFERIERKKKLMALAQNDEPEKNLKTIATAKITPIHEMVVAMLRYMLTKKEPVSFEELMERANTRSELVASFIALLQLIRKGQVSIISDDPENPLLEINHERDKFTANT
jgi:segregation and condensation protein A